MALELTELQRLQQVTDRISVAFYVCDRDSRYLMANPAYGDVVGLEPEAIIGRFRAEVLPPALVSPALASDARVLCGETASDEVTDAHGRKVSAVKFAVRDQQGEVYAICGIVTDATDVQRMRLELEHLAAVDPLTGLHTRRHLLEALDTSLTLAAAEHAHGAVLLMDVDNFRAVNDSLGHAAGDEILRAVADALRGRMRDTDLIARLSGDEFVAVLWGDTESGALGVAAELRTLLGAREQGPIRLSIGISTFADGERTTAEDLLVAADVAFHEAKEAGGDQARVYRWQSASAFSWVRRIRAALDQSRLELLAQPILQLRTDRVVMHELLVRLRTDDGDLIPPAAFIPAAEHFGLIGEIDHWVIRRALEFAAAGHHVGVNISAQSLADNSLIELVRRAVAGGVDPCKVMVEVTETAAISNIPQAQMLARSLAEIGCSLALDDFGTGFGSFSYLKHLPAEFIKIDMDFVGQVANNGTDREIVRSIVGIASALGKRTIAEGVEDQETLDVLRELGADYAQGFHIGRPQPLLVTPRRRSHPAATGNT